MDKLRVAEEMSAALRFLDSGDFLAAALRCDHAASVCLALGGFKIGTQRECLQCKELEDITADVKPDSDSEASGTLAERVRALVEMAEI